MYSTRAAADNKVGSSLSPKTARLNFEVEDHSYGVENMRCGTLLMLPLAYIPGSTGDHDKNDPSDSQMYVLPFLQGPAPAAHEVNQKVQIEEVRMYLKSEFAQHVTENRP